MNKSKKILALLLAALMLTPAFVSCAESEENADPATEAPAQESGNEAAADAAEEVVEEVEPEFLPDDLPDTLNFNDAEVGIFCWDSWDKHEFFVEEDTGEIVDSAIYYRNMAVEERLGVKLAWDLHARNDAAYGSDLKNSVKQQNSSGDGTYDIVACYANRVASCAIDGDLMNLRDGEYIDFEKPWYYKSATEAGTLHKGFTYLCAGDLSYNALARMSGVFFNQDMITNYGLEDPYELVLEGAWTIDKMHEMIKELYIDTNANGKQDDDDQFGVMVANDQIQTLYYGTGSHFIDHDENGNPKVSDDVNSEKTLTILEKYLSLFSETAAYKNNTGDDPHIFDEGRSLFYIYPLGHVSEEGMRTSEIVYGFIPQPKVDESETDYHASVTNAVTVWGIPLVIESTERASAVMECLASEGYRQVSPVVFEQAYKLKYNYDDSARQSTIFDMLRANAVFDLGKIFGSEMFGSLANGMIGNMIWNNQDNFASQVKANERVWQKSMEKIGKKLDFGE